MKTMCHGKPWKTHRASLLIFCLALSPLSARADEKPTTGSNPTQQLETFLKKVAEAATENGSSVQRTSDQLLISFRNAISQGNYDKARQTLGALSMHLLPENFHSEWLDLAPKLDQQLAELESKAVANWKAQIEQLVEDTRTACLSATKAEDLDSILIRCAALQMKRMQQNTVLGERVAYQLNGCAQTLESWSKYLDFKNAGNTSSANSALKSLLSNTSQFPVISREEIDKRFQREDTQMSAADVLADCYQGIQSPDKLGELESRIQAHLAKSHEGGSNLKQELARVQTLKAARESLEKGNLDRAQKDLQNFSQMGFTTESKRLTQPLLDQLQMDWLVKKTAALSASKPSDEEGSETFLARILDEQVSAGNYEKVIQIMTISDSFLKTSGNESYAADRYAIERFLAAKRYEAAGDSISAITSYRQVMSAQRTKFAPVKDAEASLKRLLEENPELTKNNDAVLMQEIQSLRQTIQRGRPNMPGYP